jgi:hypothetical protein
VLCWNRGCMVTVLVLIMVLVGGFARHHCRQTSQETIHAGSGDPPKMPTALGMRTPYHALAFCGRRLELGLGFGCSGCHVLFSFRRWVRAVWTCEIPKATRIWFVGCGFLSGTATGGSSSPDDDECPRTTNNEEKKEIQSSATTTTLKVTGARLSTFSRQE